MALQATEADDDRRGELSADGGGQGQWVIVADTTPTGAHRDTAPGGAQRNTAPDGAHRGTAPGGAERDTARDGAQHYFTTDPTGPVRTSGVTFTAGGREFSLQAAGGVFSAGRLDPGTAVLLRKAPLPGPATEGALLDLGCGYGPIAGVLATLAPRATVYAVDVNSRALELTRANAARLGVRVEARAPDDVPEEVSFAQVWSNPPIRIGKPALHALLRRWLPRLAPDGVAWLVVARHLGGDSLAAWLADEGYGVVRHASQQGFRVLRVTRGDAGGR